MRALHPSAILFLAFIWVGTAWGVDMQTPGAVSPPLAAQEKKASIKRGVHWYRHPSFKTAAEQETYAYSLYQTGRLRASANAYQALVYAWPDSPQAATAQLALAKVQQHRELYEKAFDEYQYLVDHYPGQFDYRNVLELQFQIANYLMNAKKGAFLFFPGFDAPERAIPMFEKIIRNAPSWDKAPLAQFDIGLIHELNHEEEEAGAAYEILQNRYPNSEWAAPASFHQALCLNRLSTQRPYDENALNSARSALVSFIRTYPDSRQVTEAQALLKEDNTRRERLVFERASFYDRLAKRPGAALQAYEEFLRVFPSSDLAPTARKRIEALKAPIKGDPNS